MAIEYEKKELTSGQRTRIFSKGERGSQHANQGYPHVLSLQRQPNCCTHVWLQLST